MKILYLVPALSYTSKGILKKQYDKVKLFQENGGGTLGLFFSQSLDKSFEEKNIIHTSVDLEPVRKKFAKKIIWRVLPYLFSKKNYKIMEEVVSKHLKDVDVVYVRYSGSDFNAISIFKLIKAKGIKLVFEYNGHHYLDEKNNVKANPSFFTYYEYLNEWLFQKKFAKMADIIVGVTNELTDYYANFNSKALKFTLSNGVDVSRFPLRSPLKYNGDSIKFLFLSGSVNYWHGLDRFLNGLKKYSGKKQIELTVAGFTHKEYKEYSYDNPNIKVTFLDNVEGTELDNLFNNNHIGIGSLALHRMGLAEASVLKVREYIVRGMPFILGYNDTDLVGANELTPFYKKIEANDTLVDIESVLLFCDEVLQIEDYALKLHKIGSPIVDYQPKLKKMFNVIKQAINQ